MTTLLESLVEGPFPRQDKPKSVGKDLKQDQPRAPRLYLVKDWQDEPRDAEANEEKK
jgi:hypothetical protein